MILGKKNSSNPHTRPRNTPHAAPRTNGTGKHRGSAKPGRTSQASPAHAPVKGSAGQSKKRKHQPTSDAAAAKKRVKNKPTPKTSDKGSQFLPLIDFTTALITYRSDGVVFTIGDEKAYERVKKFFSPVTPPCRFSDEFQTISEIPPIELKPMLGIPAFRQAVIRTAQHPVDVEDGLNALAEWGYPPNQLEQFMDDVFSKTLPEWEGRCPPGLEEPPRKKPKTPPQEMLIEQLDFRSVFVAYHPQHAVTFKVGNPEQYELAKKIFAEILNTGICSFSEPIYAINNIPVAQLAPMLGNPAFREAVKKTARRRDRVESGLDDLATRNNPPQELREFMGQVFSDTVPHENSIQNRADTSQSMPGSMQGPANFFSTRQSQAHQAATYSGGFNNTGAPGKT